MQQQIKQLITESISRLQQEHQLLSKLPFVVSVEPTKKPEYGDFTSNIAMIIAKHLHLNPIEVAEFIVVEIPSNNLVKKIEVATPGFINFYVTDHAYYEAINSIINLKEKFGCINIGEGKTIIIEFVSANPTGPLHVGHGRGAAFGATVANLLRALGFKVYCEYYVNDAGRQIQVLTLSIWLRYLEIERKLPHFPEGGYRGEYIIAIAKQLKKECGDSLYRSMESLYQNLPADESNGGDRESYIDAMVQRAQKILGEKDYQLIMQISVSAILDDIRSDLEEFGVTFDEWYRESHLIKNHDVQRGIQKLQDSGFTYIKDEAIWFRATAFGDEKDRVLVRANGQTTYFASDVGYHLNKYERGFDNIVDIFGSDHHGYVPRINAFLKAFNLDTNKLNILLVQFAILYRGKRRMQMSTRSGEFVTLRQLREEVGNDAARFFYIMRKNDQHLDFDIELAKSQSTDNPVYYIQYAYARICSVMRQLDEKQLAYDHESAMTMLHNLEMKQEKNLLHRLARYPIILQTAAINYEPHLLAHYLQELASYFHAYYNAHQFLVDDSGIRNARLYLINATKQVLANGLTLLGVSTPEIM